ncbi:MAG: ATP-binding protein [Chloroflexi bacterium]|nr:ATP-binding protein [Chloroflexota bacterium]
MGDKNVLTVPGRYEKIKQICAFAADGAAQAGMVEGDIFHIELACDEACTNIIEHAYGGEGKGDIIISWKADDRSFTIVINDNGRSFNPKDVPEPAIPPDPNDPNFSEAKMVENLKIGGLGIHFMRKLMDEVTYQFDAATGNTLILVKKW